MVTSLMFIVNNWDGDFNIGADAVPIMITLSRIRIGDFTLMY
jgi:hypothetical protein